MDQRLLQARTLGFCAEVFFAVLHCDRSNVAPQSRWDFQGPQVLRDDESPSPHLGEHCMCVIAVQKHGRLFTLSNCCPCECGATRVFPSPWGTVCFFEAGFKGLRECSNTVP